MLEFLQDLSPPALAAANEANLCAAFGSLSAVSGCEVLDTDEFLRVITGAPVPLFNGVFRARFPDNQVDEKIEQALAPFRERAIPMFWWTGPSTAPAHLRDRLVAHGLVRSGPGIEDNLPGMAVALDALNDRISAPSGLTIERVTEHTAEQWSITCIVGSGMPAEFAGIFLEVIQQLGFREDQAWRHYLARLDGEPVATASLFLGAGVAGIYSVATLPDARRRGIGSAVTLAPLREARSLGCQAGTLQASKMGMSVYQRLGFRECCRFGQYLWSAE